MVEAGAEVVNSTITGPAIIGERTRVVNSTVGPFTSIAADCEIVDSEIDHSVVLEHSRIVSVPRVVDSLIGKHAEVVRSGEHAAGDPPDDRRPLADLELG